MRSLTVDEKYEWEYILSMLNILSVLNDIIRERVILEVSIEISIGKT